MLFFSYIYAILNQFFKFLFPSPAVEHKMSSMMENCSSLGCLDSFDGVGTLNHSQTESTPDMSRTIDENWSDYEADIDSDDDVKAHLNFSINDNAVVKGSTSILLSRQQFEKLQDTKLQESTAFIYIDAKREENINTENHENILSVIEYDQGQSTNIKNNFKTTNNKYSCNYKPYFLPQKRLFTRSNKNNLEGDKKLLDLLNQCSEKEKVCAKMITSLCDTSLTLISTRINDIEAARESNTLFCTSIASALRKMSMNENLDCKQKILQVILDAQSIPISSNNEP